MKGRCFEVGLWRAVGRLGIGDLVKDRLVIPAGFAIAKDE
jgi:hypothetical protein